MHLVPKNLLIPVAWKQNHLKDTNQQSLPMTNSVRHFSRRILPKLIKVTTQTFAPFIVAP